MRPRATDESGLAATWRTTLWSPPYTLVIRTLGRQVIELIGERETIDRKIKAVDKDLKAQVLARGSAVVYRAAPATAVTRRSLPIRSNGPTGLDLGLAAGCYGTDKADHASMLAAYVPGEPAPTSPTAGYRRQREAVSPATGEGDRSVIMN